MGESKLFMNRMVVQHARDLRKNLTEAERKLWQFLRKKQLGVRFRRQVPFGKYILDFACFDPKIVIEIDGGQHADPEIEIYDQQRTLWLKSYGYIVLRFWNNQVLFDSPIPTFPRRGKEFSIQSRSLGGTQEWRS